MDNKDTKSSIIAFRVTPEERAWITSPQWHVDCSEYGGSTCARDLSHNISPVCRIILTEAL